MAAPSTAFRPGADNRRWRGGVHVSVKGYRRISHGLHRGKYEHRRRMEEMLAAPLCASYVFPEPGVIPARMTVEHLDHQKQHNCDGNLMLLEACIHNAITAAGVRYIRAHYAEYVAMVESREMPDWVNELEEVSA